MRRFFVAMAVAAVVALGQDINLAQFESLKAKASQATELNITEAMINMAKGFVGNDKEAKEILNSVKGIYIRSYEFEKEGQYSMADVDAIRNQLKRSGWQVIVDVTSSKPGGDNAGIYMRTDGSKMNGFIIISMEPKQLSVINISGSLDPSKLQALSGTLGIPNFNIGFDQTKGKGNDKKGKEEE